MLEISILDSISVSGYLESVNQDYISVQKNCILSLDGATPLQNSELYPVAQFVSDFTTQFIHDLPSNKDIVSLIVDVCNKLMVQKNIPETSFPSASAIILTHTDNKLILTQVGDCKAYTSSRDVLFPTTKIERLDKIALQMLSEYQNLGFTFNESKKLIQPTLQLHRELKNKKNGYPTLSAGIENAKHLILQQEIKLNKNEELFLLLCSDGFYMGFEAYLPKTLNKIFSKELDLKTALSKYREIEKQDKYCTQFPRFKQSDDASAVLIKVKYY